VLSSQVLGETSIVNEVRIEKWVYGGDSLGRLSGNADASLNGRVVLTPFTLPGELARVDVGEDIRANLIEVLDPAPERTVPPCPHFGRCGGCHYQHAPYDFQLARKVEILREQLRRVGKIDYQGEIEVISGPPLAYRNRAQFHIIDGRIGYLAARSHELVAIRDECPISSPRLNQTLAMIRDRLSDARFPKFVHSIEVFTNENELQVNAIDTDRPVARSFYEWMESTVALDYQTALGTFRVSPRSFFQVNRFLIEPLVNAAFGPAAGRSALDLYAGVGLFAIPLARRFESVTAVEAGVTAARDLDVNSENAKVKVTTEQRRVEDYLAKLEKAPDFVLADPPRAGLGKMVVGHLNRIAPQRLTIVSCDPATLARDVAALQYKIDRLILVDLFPQTYHLETIAHLSRES
jgi:23S rRNA (uracil1939-C5)-methyltransferase